MDEQFKQFVIDVQHNYVYSNSRVDNEYNFIATIEGRNYFVNRDKIMIYYDAFKNTSIPYKEWVSRTTGYITQLVEKWYKRWH